MVWTWCRGASWLVASWAEVLELDGDGMGWDAIEKLSVNCSVERGVSMRIL